MWDRRVLAGVTALGFALPVAAYIWFLHRYAVNVPDGQWADVLLIGHSYNGTLHLSTLWALHNENRIFFPNLIVLALSRTTHFNVAGEEFLSALMLFASIGLIVCAHHRRSGRAWIYYVPVAFLMLSFVQNENTLSGFQIAWFLVLLCLAGTLFVLDRPALTWVTLSASVVIAIVGSFSSLQGLLIWPMGLVLLYHRRRTRAFVLTWIGSAVAAGALYFYRYQSNPTAPKPSYAVVHPIVGAKFFLFALGNVLGVAVKLGGRGNYGVLLFGAVIFVLAFAVLILYGLKRDQSSGGPIGVALIFFGVLFGAMITDGRIRFYNLAGYPWAAAASRYTTFDLLVLVGIYLALLGRPTLHVRREDQAVLAAQVTIAAVIWLQVVVGIGTGLSGGKNYYELRVRDAAVLTHLTSATPSSAMRELGPINVSALFFGSTSELRTAAHIAAEHHLSLFDNGP